MTCQELEAEYLESKVNLVQDETPHGDYYAMLDQDIKKGSVLLRLNGWNHLKLTWVECWIYKLKKIYILNTSDESYADKNTVYVKPKTKEYLNALATAQYIITDHLFEDWYVKRKGQIVISAPKISIPGNILGTQRNHHNCICDYCMRPVGRKFRIKVLLEAFGLRSIITNLKPYEKNQNSVLFMTNTKYLRFVVDFLNLMADRFCTENTNACLFIVDGSVLKKNKDTLLTLDKRIKVYSKKGPMIYDQATALKRRFVELVFSEQYDIDAFNEFLSEKLFATEVRRIFGDKKFVEIYNFGYMSPYVQLLLSHMSGKKTFIPYKTYASVKDYNYMIEMSRLDIYDQIGFFNRPDYVRIAESYPRWAGKYVFMDFRGAKRIPPQEEQRIISLNDGLDYYVLRDSRPKGLSISIVSIAPLNEFRQGDYIIIDNTLAPNDWAEMLKALEKRNIKPVVFDFYDNLRDMQINNYIISDLSLYYIAVHNLKNRYIYIGSSESMKKDAQKMSHQYIYINKTGNVCDEYKVSTHVNSFLDEDGYEFLRHVPLGNDNDLPCNAE